MSAVSSRVIVRNGIGRFVADCEGAATATVKDALEEGVAVAKDHAPIGTKHDLRSTPIMASFYTEILGRTSGVFGNFSRHAIFQEKGAGPHPITGDVYFYWENQGRWWEPGDNIIQHPGNPAHPFLRPGYRAIARRITQIAARHYPG